MYTAVRTQSCLSISAAGWLSPLETPINIPQWPRLVSLLKPSLTRTELPSHLISLLGISASASKAHKPETQKTQNRWSKEPPQPVVAFPQRLVGHRATVSTALPGQAPESGSAGEKGSVRWSKVGPRGFHGHGYGASESDAHQSRRRRGAASSGSSVHAHPHSCSCTRGDTPLGKPLALTYMKCQSVPCPFCRRRSFACRR
ncbi:hypothetical protein HDV62DRAFT_36118 [Trichoderma sp. SZMC 28011]